MVKAAAGLHRQVAKNLLLDVHIVDATQSSRDNRSPWLGTALWRLLFPTETWPGFEH